MNGLKRIMVGVSAVLLLAATDARSGPTNETKWSLSFLVVDETGNPLPGAKIWIMDYTNVETGKDGTCSVSGTGTPDGWQCHFSKSGYRKKSRMYSGPSNFSGFSGPEPASQRHTEMLVSSNASPKAFPRWKMAIKAIDVFGNPVADAEARIYYRLDKVAEGITDRRGFFSYSDNLGSWNIHLGLQKPGFYKAGKLIELGDRETYTPEKWNQTVTLQLVKIDSTPMYAKREEAKIKKENEPVGFDLIAGDWVVPYGVGSNADLFFAARRQIVSDKDYNAELRVTFPNNGDGILAVPPLENMGTPLHMPHSAPENGYQPERIWHFGRGAKQDPVQGYFFRVHTKLDKNGKVQTALYGKIHGDFRFYAGTKAPSAGMGFNYYLNPITNSLNVEFDPQKNLVKKLSFMEEVKEP